MSFIGVVGVVAQAAQGAITTAPTSVSIATSASGNYNNAISAGTANCSFVGMAVDGLEFSSGSGTVDVDVSQFSQHFPGCANGVTQTYQGYIRATGATSFQWGGSLNSSSLSNSCSASVLVSGSTDQDETGTNGHTGLTLLLAFGGGRGGLTYPASGDEIVLKFTASATNSNGTTDASTVTLTYDFVI
tara:strand:+ start:979 stop:1542 length:564 start_codon:yes stop_codon:yes gene_type:complete